ncbi:MULTISPECIES: DsbA family protein [Actinomadura]|uniref:DsbA family protein n=1 Tax=Actinomadura yumaensis TaxID=111807 RepID=A0ABW2CWU2_9ACTN|nr:thioredoxin domain-containing protein [Actinomadura sp. J1-007]MWK32703.1 thioredoxin domain-containing protein [Actinomadura sp. J1-007]
MSNAGRERSARDRLAERRAADAARRRKQRLLLVVLGAVAAAAVAVVVVTVVVRQGDDDPGPSYGGALAPTARQPDGSVAMAAAGVTAPVLEVYEDFQCPACRHLEDTLGATIKELAAQGKAKVVYRPFQLFRQEPLKSNSRRAANAAECAPADRWVQYHDRIYGHQPPEGDKGFSNADLIEWAGKAGIAGDPFARCVNGGQRLAAVDRAGAHAQQAGVTGTPHLALNGAKIADEALASPDALRKAVQDAGRNAPAPGGSASPSR